MSWRFITTALLFTAMGCGSDTVTPSNQSFGDFSDWAEGIEGFASAPTGTTDTGGSGSSVNTYDGAYSGTYNLSISSSGYTCSFQNITLQTFITNGEMTTPFLTDAVQTCDLGYGSQTYTMRIYFDGTASADTTLTGTFAEDSVFIFEGDWTGFAMDLGGTYQISGTFNQNVNSVNPGGLISVSGSFNLNQQ